MAFGVHQAVLLLCLFADPAPTSAGPARRVAPPRPALTDEECGRLADHGFALYLAGLPKDPGILEETRSMTRAQRSEHLREVARLLTLDRDTYITEGKAQCLEWVRTGRATRKRLECALAAKEFGELERCVGISLRGRSDAQR